MSHYYKCKITNPVYLVLKRYRKTVCCNATPNTNREYKAMTLKEAIIPRKHRSYMYFKETRSRRLLSFADPKPQNMLRIFYKKLQQGKYMNKTQALLNTQGTENDYEYEKISEHSILRPKYGLIFYSN